MTMKLKKKNERCHPNPMLSVDEKSSIYFFQIDKKRGTIVLMLITKSTLNYEKHRFSYQFCVSESKYQRYFATMNKHIVNYAEFSSVLIQSELGELGSTLEHLTNGWTNFTFKFSTKPNGKTYILRIYKPGPLRKISYENIKLELDFVSYLYKELNLPVAPMIEPPGMFKLENNDNYCVIFPFICGVKYLDTSDTPVRQLWQTLEIAYFLGKMHSNIKTKQFPIIELNRCSVNLFSIKYKLVYSCEQFANDHPDLYERIRFMTDKSIKSIPLLDDDDEQELYRSNIENALPNGYIHADIHDDNVLFSCNKEKLVAVLDFDDMYYGPLLIDLAITLCLWCSIGSRFDFEYAKMFLIHYQNERQMNLTDNEWNLLETYCYLTILNQILFVIEAEHHGKPIRNMINELLLPIEYIAKEEKKFLEKIR